ncbi:MAG: LuxR C-terminal-related transcriptional regulator [Thermoanaerobaculia bacterium]
MKSAPAAVKCDAVRCPVAITAVVDLVRMANLLERSGRDLRCWKEFERRAGRIVGALDQRELCEVLGIDAIREATVRAQRLRHLCLCRSDDPLLSEMSRSEMIEHLAAGDLDAAARAALLFLPSLEELMARRLRETTTPEEIGWADPAVITLSANGECIFATPAARERLRAGRRGSLEQISSSAVVERLGEMLRNATRMPVGRWLLTPMQTLDAGVDVLRVRMLLAGRNPFSPQLAHIVIEPADELGRHLAELTPREREILHLIVRGMSNGEIARTLAIGIETVKTHASRILRKVRCRGRSELIHRVLSRIPASSTPLRKPAHAVPRKRAHAKKNLRLTHSGDGQIELSLVNR